MNQLSTNRRLFGLIELRQFIATVKKATCLHNPTQSYVWMHNKKEEIKCSEWMRQTLVLNLVQGLHPYSMKKFKKYWITIYYY